MYVNLGKKLKALRKERDLTQEQLAECLGISSQAVSKWETNSSYPDISMLPVLANFYNVTTDELLGVDITKTREKIKAYSNEMFELYNAWKLKEMVDVARKACAEFPGDDELLYNLAWALGQAQNVIRTKSENLDEAILLAERILNNSKDTGMRLRTISLLAYLYHWNGNDGKALDYLEKAFEYAGKYEDYDDNLRYASALMSGEKPYERIMYSQGAYQDLLNELTDEDASRKFGKLKDNKRYKALISQLAGRVQ